MSSEKPDLDAIAHRHGVSKDAVSAALLALQSGGGRQAQFNHPELGGLGQWSSGGMTMVGDMFNNGLKAKVSALFEDLTPFATLGPGADTKWGSSARWPADLGPASSTGSQNDMHYAVFPGQRRLAVEKDGKLTIYDTAHHRISGVSQQQSTEQTLAFTGADGPVSVGDLTVLQKGETAAPANAPNVNEGRENSAPPSGSSDITDQIGRLHDLLTRGALTQKEYDIAKERLLARF